MTPREEEIQSSCSYSRKNKERFSLGRRKCRVLVPIPERIRKGFQHRGGNAELLFLFLKKNKKRFSAERRKSRVLVPIPEKPRKGFHQGGGNAAGAGGTQPLAAQEAEKANKEQCKHLDESCW